ncbi:glycosyltransferase family 4 protein [Edwardsiella tarda]|uniref:glycosyltransferase n=1 Tax=Edwardsiella tarda TaxID=636 RepID=UPI00308150F9|nr:glycosyltransferase family 4 protein [Edwardsiella tarda]
MGNKKILSIAFSDSRGGAAIAAKEQVAALRNIDGINISQVVVEKNLSDGDSKGPSKISYLIHFLLRILVFIILLFQRSKNSVKHSLNIFSSSFVLREIDSFKDGVIHFHWINNEVISISKIRKILMNNNLCVFTLHDEWFFCGAEHYSSLDSSRYITGYKKSNKDVSLIDLDRFAYNLKLKLKPYLNNSNVIFTAPSTYLVNKARASSLLSNATIFHVPNIIDVNLFKRRDEISKEDLNISQDSFVILFGAIGGVSYLKGGDLLFSALEKLSQYKIDKNVTLLTFGGESNKYKLFGFDVIGLGHIDDRIKLSSIYSLSDVTIVPSRLEAFGQVAAESLACETPVIAFRNTGIEDLIKHGSTGYLIESYDINSMATHIKEFIGLPLSERRIMGRGGRVHIIENYSSDVVSRRWLEIYDKVKR